MQCVVPYNNTCVHTDFYLNTDLLILREICPWRQKGDANIQDKLTNRPVYKNSHCNTVKKKMNNLLPKTAPCFCYFIDKLIDKNHFFLLLTNLYTYILLHRKDKI